MSDKDRIQIMVAEDIDLLREDFCETINMEEDMEVVGSAGRGDEIVALVDGADPKPDVILMDVEMEELDSGIKAAQIISENHPSVKVVFMTAHETDEMIQAGMSTGAVDYVVKGCESEVLLSHIRRAYRDETILQSQVQRSVMREFSRLQDSERSLLFFIHNVSKLTNAEREIIRLLLQKKKVREIAEIRGVEIVTVKTQISGLLYKFGCRRTKEIMALIQKMRLEQLFLEE